jgi:hypothetical protein
MGHNGLHAGGYVLEGVNKAIGKMVSPRATKAGGDGPLAAAGALFLFNTTALYGHIPCRYNTGNSAKENIIPHRY